MAAVRPRPPARHVPRLPQRPGYNKRLRVALRPVKRAIGLLAADTAFWFDNVWITDSTPVECARSRPTVKRSDLAGWAAYGPRRAADPGDGCRHVAPGPLRQHPISDPARLGRQFAQLERETLYRTRTRIQRHLMTPRHVASPTVPRQRATLDTPKLSDIDPVRPLIGRLTAVPINEPAAELSDASPLRKPVRSGRGPPDGRGARSQRDKNWEDGDYLNSISVYLNYRGETRDVGDFSESGGVKNSRIALLNGRLSLPVSGGLRGGPGSARASSTQDCVRRPTGTATPPPRRGGRPRDW